MLNRIWDLTESLEHERVQLGNYKTLLKMVEGDSVYIEEYARQMIYDEETHISEVEKMIRKSGSSAWPVVP